MSFGDLYTVQPGQGNPEGLPPVDLPKVEGPPRRKPLQVEITKGREADPYAGHALWGESTTPKNESDPYAEHPLWGEQPAPRQGREIGTGESAARGAIEGLSFGAQPALAGLAEAGTAGLPQAKGVEREPGAAEMIAGLVRLGYEHFLAPEGKATEAYRKTRDEMRQENESAATQNPKSYIAGQVGGALLTPSMGAIKGATMAGRVANAAKSGAISGGLYGAGEGTSEGQSPGDVAISAAKGAATGGMFGAGGSTALETGAKIAKRARNIVQGAYDPGKVAGRQLGTTLRADYEHGGAGIDPEAAAAARNTGLPLAVMDIGQQGTRDLARYAANSSSQALADIEHFTRERALDQHPRLANFLTRLTGRASNLPAEPQAARFGRMIRESTAGAGVAADQATLQEAARRANRPAYSRAYAAGDREIWSPELERMTSAPSIKQSMQAAVNKWKDWQVVDGFGGVNPGATVGQGGILTIRGGRTGVPAFPNIQFWDYTARNIADKAEAARRAGRTQLAAQLGGLERQLKTELDRLVPEYQQARRGAAQFFGANDALEAGQAFARTSANIGQARIAHAQMSAPERELFARGYASEKADQIERNAPGGNLLDSASLASPAERQKMELALGPQRTAALDRAMAPDRLYHAFDGAASAEEAGRNFVAAEVSRENAARSLARMSPQDRDSFARNFGQELSRSIMDRQDNMTVVNKAFIDSHRARDKINLALGTDRARELEAALRAEAVADKAKSIIGGSATQRNLNLAKIIAAHGGHATVGAGAVIGLESLKETDLSPGAIIGGAIVLGGLRHGAYHIDAKVARRLGEMLISGDPAVVRRATQTVARSPQLFNALRNGTETGMRVAAHDIGGNRALAGVAAVLEHIMAEEAPSHHHTDDPNATSQPVNQ